MSQNFNYLNIFINSICAENIQLDIDNSIETALFDLKNRVIYLPGYVFNSEDVLICERLICHEIGHALYSPPGIMLDHPTIDSNLINLVEDIRIENLLKETYKGCGSLFTQGYLRFEKLLDKKFGKGDHENLFFVDKINEYFKSNYFIPHTFSEKEQPIVKELLDLKKVEDVIPIVLKIIALTKQEKKKQRDQDKKNLSSIKTDSPMKDPSSHPEDSGSSEDSEDQNQEESREMESITNLTDQEISGISEELIKKSNLWKEKAYTKDLKNSKNQTMIINPSPPLIAKEKEFWESIPDLNFFEDKVKEYYTLIERASATLTAEFNRKKNAKNFQNISRVKTGELDLTRLSKYKISSNLFKTINKLPKQKNHEVIILLDWSSSISNVLVSLVTQACIIYDFCHKNNIPCNIYAFTSNIEAIAKFFIPNISNKRRTSKEFQDAYEKLYPEYEKNKHLDKPYFCLFQLLSTDSKKREPVKQFITKVLNLALFVSGYYWNMDYSTNISFNALGRETTWLNLHSTPLFSSLFHLGDLIKNNKNKKTNLIIITDGISDRINFKHTNLLDNQTKKFYPANSYDDYNNTKMSEFLCKRLTDINPNLQCTYIHVGTNIQEAISKFGLELNINHISTIRTKMRNESVVEVKYNNFNAILILNNSNESDQELLLDNTKINNKKSSLEILKKLNNNLVKTIYKKIAGRLA